MQWIRWSGLIFFLALIGLIAALWFALAAPVIKNSLEHFGSKAAGAKVSVNEVSLQLNPFGIDLRHVAVADAKEPMRNVFEFEHAAAHVDFLKLLMGQVIIEDMSIKGVQLNTPRSSSGALPQVRQTKEKVKKETTKKLPEMFEDSGIDLPDADELLKKEPLLTDQRKDEWDSLYAGEKDKLQQVSKALPSKETLTGYEAEIKNITQGKITSLEDFETRKEKLKQLKQSVRQDRDKLKNARDQYQQSYQSLTTQLSLLKQAPGEDRQRLKEKYSLDELGVANISRLLFGETITSVSLQIVSWYEKIKPFVASAAEKKRKEKEQKPDRRAGRYIHFPTNNPTPDFLLRKADFSLALALGQLAGTVKDFTHQPEIIRRPARLRLEGKELKQAKHFLADAVFDHIDADKASDRLNLSVTGLRLQDVSISQSSKMPIRLAQAKTDISGELRFEENTLQGKANGHFTDAQFTGGTEKGLAKELGRALANIHQFTLDADFSGAIDDVDIGIRSDLDRQLKTAVEQRLKQRERELQQQLKQKLEDRVKSYLADNSSKLSGLLSEQDIMDGKLNQLDDLLKQKLDAYKDQKKDELKDKLKNKLRNKLSL